MLTNLTNKWALMTLLQLAIGFFAWAQPQANFTVSNTAGCSPLTVSFTNTSTGNNLSYKWDLGNSNTATTKDASAIYYIQKTYSITLTVTDGSTNKSSSVTKTVIVYAVPTAQFKADVTIGCPPFKVTFSDQSTGSSTIVSWLWDFGDGTTDTHQNPSPHTYTSPGNYDVSLQVTDQNGCKNSINKGSFIDASKPPVIDFTSSSTGSCIPPTTINFTSKVTSISSGFTYSWDFGDGSPQSTSQNPSHTYTKSGSFDVSLTVTDVAGCSNTLVKSGFIFIGKPKADFQFNPGSGCAPLTVSFSDNSSGLGPGSSYWWDFGDGSHSTQEFPAHSFAVGSYNITFAVTSGAGCQDTITKSNCITVTKGFKPSFTADSILCQSPFTTTFFNTSGAGTTVVLWDFGDSTTSTQQSPTHTYKPGSGFPPSGPFFPVTLTVSDANGCIEQLTKNNFIDAKSVTAVINVPGDQAGCAPYNFVFKNGSTSNDSFASTKWVFGDGTTSTLFDPGHHLYTDTGIFKVILTVTTKKGCTASANTTVKSGTLPTADFSSQPDSGCLNKMRHVHFLNLTDTHGSIRADSYSWDFGDGQTSHDPSPSHKYTIKPGKYDVRLIASNKGCNDTLKKKKLIVIAGPWAQYVTNSSGCIANIISFFDSSIDANRVDYHFGDGDTTLQRNPVHTYSAGTYDPFQIVYNDTFGCSDTFRGPPIVVKKPWEVSLDVDKNKGCWPLTVFFTLKDNDDADNTINFGDGTTVTYTSVDTPIRVVPHIYTSRGVYHAYLVATNSNKCSDTIKIPNNITANGPSINFTVDKTAGCAPLKVLLTDLSTKDKTIKVKVYDMGDGHIINVTRDTMSYTYTTVPNDQNAGFTITEQATDTAGCTNWQTTQVYPSKPVPDFTIDSNVTCKNVIYSLNPTDVGLGPFKYLWDLGNGTIDSTDRSPLVIYKNGPYKVHLKMTDNNGCTDSITRPLLVRKQISHADFYIDSTNSTCPPFFVVFHNLSTFAFGGYRQFQWNFGDGSPISSQSDPQKVYFNAGTFSVSLKITDSLGCSDSISKPSLINIKGAVGTYSYDKTRGCVPLTVHFKAISKNATKFIWDLGDGQLDSGSTVTHTYNAPRKYLPALNLSDSFGCSYFLPSKDTIIVDPLPSPAFTFDSLCSGLPTFFYDQSSPGSGVITKWNWDFGDGGTATGSNPLHTFKKNGYYYLKLGVTSSYGCYNRDSTNIKIGGVTASFTSPVRGCLGTPIQFTDQSNSDTAIESWIWLFGDGDSSHQQSPLHYYLKKGQYTISLFVRNYKGCVDTLIKKNYLIMGDTVPPPPPTLYRVSVVNDNQVEVDFSRFIDVDFDHYDVWMEDQSGKFNVIDHISNVDDTVYIANVPSTLHNVYCFKVQSYNICNHFSKLSPSHCSINVTALPGADKALVNWTPYVGWAVREYKIYRESFYSPGVYVLIDSVPGSTLNYIDSDLICYRPATFKILAVQDSVPAQVSWSDTSTTLPVHVNKVPAANMLRVTVPDNKNTEIFWKDTATIKVEKWMVEKSVDGINYLLIDSPFVRSVLSVIDKKVDVQHKSYYYRVNMMDSCGDLGPYSHIGKSILLGTDTTPDVRPYLHWNAYEDWPEGVMYYEIQIKDAYGNYNWLANTNSGKDTQFTDFITDRNSLPSYCYRIVAHRNGPPSNPIQNFEITSMSNEACLTVKSRVFVPNAFTPNNDELNDSFIVKGLYIREYHIQIFDRWGSKVFESSSLKDNWDGKFKKGWNGLDNKDHPLMDSYKYIIYVRGVDNQQYFLTGWITIVI